MAISKKTLQELEFKTLDEYFEHMAMCHSSGQFSRLRTLYNALSKKQKAACIAFLNDGLQTEKACADYLIEATFKPSNI